MEQWKSGSGCVSRRNESSCQDPSERPHAQSLVRTSRGKKCCHFPNPPALWFYNILNNKVEKVIWLLINLLKSNCYFADYFILKEIYITSNFISYNIKAAAANNAHGQPQHKNYQFCHCFFYRKCIFNRFVKNDLYLLVFKLSLKSIFWKKKMFFLDSTWIPVFAHKIQNL